jgi:hypothetical protein
MAGGDDDAGAKEQWFMAKFGVDGIFTPENPVFSARGAVVTNIAHIPMALTAVMRENATRPDFPPEGSLALKPWFASTRGISLPAALDLPVVEAVAPYNEQIALLNRQVGTVLPRQSLKDASGASQLDPKTQVASLHGVSMLDAAQNPLETNIALALVHEAGGENDRALVNVAVGSFLNLHGTPVLVAAQAAREDGNAPNAVMAAAACLIGPRRVEPARRAVRFMVDAFAEAGLKNALDEDFGFGSVVPDDAMRGLLVGKKDADAEALLAGLRERGVRSVFVRYLGKSGREPVGGWRAGGDCGYSRLGAADAEADFPAVGREPALGNTAARHAAGGVGRGEPARGGALLRRSDRRDPGAPLADGGGVSRAAGPGGGA